LKNDLKSQIKVAQLSGHVSERTAYHHGEVSLQTTIVNMAQNYVGANNINLLEPLGQFGECFCCYYFE
jgi:DNA topoisomerase-2